MMLLKKKQNRFHLSFKAKEVPVYIPMEEYLMDDLDIPTRSDTYKIALKNLYRERTGTLGDGMKQIRISSVQYEMLVALGKAGE